MTITLESSTEFDLAKQLRWHQSGGDWLLFSNRRRMGRASPSSCDGMYRVTLSGGRHSDMANLSWTKAHIMETALRELAYEYREKTSQGSSHDTP